MASNDSAWEKAAKYIERAQSAPDHETRAFYLRLAISWSRIADNYEFLTRTDALTLGRHARASDRAKIAG
jgi:hypothetical protein